MAFSPKIRKYLIIFLVIGWAVILINKFAPEKIYRNNRLLMGTFWEVTSADKKAAQIVFYEAERIENLLSKYQTSSQIYQLNHLGKLKVSDETFYVIKKAMEYWRLTDGAFDITIGPLIELWGFTNKNFGIPSDNKIKIALKLVGCDKIILEEKDKLVKFKIRGMKIDLGGIAKGYALDCAVKKLKENNINNCLISAGGQVYALGSKSAGPWKVAIRGPRKNKIVGSFKLKNQSASTSADYEQFFMKDNKRYCHILNPETGYPANSGIKSVTVVADKGMDADVFSTAIFILGREKFKALFKKNSVAIVRIF
ncbi:MAG: FAD:protein FMN transferase [Candidatus Omnitrophota bacterium]